MPDNSARLLLPYIQASQAQKHVTHNEALRRLDILVQAAVQSLSATTPPGVPVDGETYVLGSGATGAWAGQDGNLAAWIDNAWDFFTPQPGWSVLDLATDEVRTWDGSAWILPKTETQNLAGLGINASSDMTNRISVSSPATLLSHEGAGHQLKLNKASAADTASLLFQDNWSGRTEMGLAGNDDFSVKVSADGSSWTTALKVDSARGTSEVKGLTSGTLTIANDSTGIITPPWTGGFVLLTIVHVDYPQSRHSGILAYDTGPSPLLETMTLAANMVNQGTTTLTGTTGAVGNTSVAVATAQLVVENRFGSARTYSYTFLGGEQ